MANRPRPIPKGRLRRTMPLAGFSARAAGGRLVAGLREKAGQDGAVERFHERTAERYAEALGHSKGVLMKAGQIISMVDARAVGTGGFWPYQKAMSRLQADAPPMHPALLHEVLAAELGPAVGHFAEFTAEPMAAASIGQVHRAVLTDGRQVAVKIQYPGVARAIRDDLANAELLATFLRFATAAAGIKADVRAAAREATARISEEIDYCHEAANITAFSEIYRAHPFIRIPEVVPDLSGERVLTMSYLDGMDYAHAQRADQDLKNTWAEAISRFDWGSLRHANLMHADPHPGNYRFNTDGSIGVVDFGCVKVLRERQRQQLIAMTRATLEGRKADLRDCLVQMGFLEVDSDLSAEELYQWQAQLFYEAIEMPQPATYTPDTTGRVMRAIFDQRDPRHPMARMHAPEDFVFLSRNQLAIGSIRAGLNYTAPARAIYDDMDGVSEPTTELGKLHHAWVRERGLPGALDHHDHP